MNLLGSSRFGRTIKATGLGAALLLSMQAGHAQSGGPFAGCSNDEMTLLHVGIASIA